MVEDLATPSEGDTQYIIYRALYDDTKLYIRPLKMFLSEADKDKYPNCKQTHRLELQNIKNVNSSHSK